MLKEENFSVDKAIFNQTQILLNIIISVHLTGKEVIIYCVPLFHATTKDIRNNGKKRVLSKQLNVSVGKK